MSLYDKAKFIFSGSAGAGNKDVAYNIKPVEKLKIDERVTNGTFDNNDAEGAWVLLDSPTVSNNQVVFHDDSTGENAKKRLYQNDVFEDGKTYRVSFEVVDLKEGRVKVGTGNNTTAITQSNHVTKSGKYSFYYTASGVSNTDKRIQISRTDLTGPYDFKIDNVSVREVEQKANDFSFVRASDLTATHEGGDGLIKKTRQNLLQYSNGFDNALWVGHTSGSTRIDTVTGGQAGYDGSNNAFLLNKDSSDLFKRREQIVAETAGVATFSVYAKAGTASSITLRGGSDDNANVQNGNDDQANFDLANGTSSTVNDSITSSMEAITGSAGDTDRWYRCSVVFKDPTQLVQIYVNFNSASTGTVFVQNSQLENGLVATPYIDRTDSFSNSTAGIQEDEPRYDYSLDNALPPALLFEPQRRNLVKHSEYLSNYNTHDATKTINALTSPEGVNNAATINVTSNSGSIYAQSGSVVESVEPETKYTFSFYVKRGTNTENYLAVRAQNPSPETFISEDVEYTASTTEWKRISHTFTTPAGCTSIRLYPQRYTSGGQGTTHLFGIQLEKGDYATSYIPTYGSAATRSGDVATIENINAGTSYTILFDFDATSNLNTNTILYYFFDDNDKSSQSDAIFTPRWYKTGAENDSFRVYDQRGLAYPITSAYTSTTKKWVMRVDGTSFDLFRDNAGTPQKITGASLSGTRFLQKISIRPNRQLIKQLIIFDSALTDGECLSLTT